MASGQWSGPVCLQTLAMTLGPQIGFRKSDTLLCLLDDGAIEVFSKAIDGFGQIKLGGQLAVAAGPVGRDAALDARLGQGGVTTVLSYSHSQGAYGGVTAEGETMFGRQVSGRRPWPLSRHRSPEPGALLRLPPPLASPFTPSLPPSPHLLTPSLPPSPHLLTPSLPP